MLHSYCSRFFWLCNAAASDAAKMSGTGDGVRIGVARMVLIVGRNHSGVTGNKYNRIL